VSVPLYTDAVNVRKRTNCPQRTGWRKLTWQSKNASEKISSTEPLSLRRLNNPEPALGFAQNLLAALGSLRMTGMVP
jgi:hypothetical protein